jgi:hypothetical protein
VSAACSIAKVQGLTPADGDVWNGVWHCSCGKRFRWSETWMQSGFPHRSRELFRSHYDRDESHPYTRAIATLLRAWGDRQKVIGEVGRWTPADPGPVWAESYATSQL